MNSTSRSTTIAIRRTLCDRTPRPSATKISPSESAMQSAVDRREVRTGCPSAASTKRMEEYRVAGCG